MPHPVRFRPTPWKTVILLCGKCARKINGGYGPKKKQTLLDALRAELKADGRRRRVWIIETRCIGVCPKKAVTALNASSPGRILTVPKGTHPKDALTLLIPDSAEAAVAL
jgi:predicted metal-binding protein